MLGRAVPLVIFFACATAFFGLRATSAHAFETGVSYNSSTGDQVEVLDLAGDLNTQIVRTFVSWQAVVGGRPVAPSNPADPSYRFGPLDEAITKITSMGMTPLLTVYEAPSWAEGAGRPASARPGSWKPNPDDLGDFMTALASRYSGGLGALPAVRYFQVWNEPNITDYLAPQWSGGKPVGVERYARMLSVSRRALKGVSPANQVVTAGLAPYGEPPGGNRTRPLVFWRKSFCLKDRKKLKKARGCGPAVGFDVFAHHAINTSGPPRQHALNPDDASSGDLGSVARILRAAERHGTVTGGRHDMWVTEFWWESNPPDPRQGYPLQKQARFVAETLYLAWRSGFDAAINFQIKDPVVDRSTYLQRSATGLYFNNGKPKPAARAFRFPLVADAKGGGRVSIWGRAPDSGSVRIEERKRGGWGLAERATAKASGVFTTSARFGKSTRIRARAFGQTSAVWRVK